MSYGSYKAFTVVAASGASTSSDVALGGRAWARYGVQVGTMSTGVNVAIQNSVDGGVTFYNVYHAPIQSASVATPQVIISSGVGTGGGYVPLPTYVSLQHVRFVGTGVVSGGVSYTIVCSD